MELENINMSVENEKMLFPWVKVVNEKFSKAFTSDYETEALQLFCLNMKKEVQNSLHGEGKSKKRIQALFINLSYFYNHFIWKISQKQEDSSEMKVCCAKLLSHLIQVGIVLSGKNISSQWIERILTAIRMFPADKDYLYSALLMISNLGKKYHDLYAAVLKHTLLKELQEHTDNPVTYVKLILLFRRLKILLKDNFDKTSVLSRAARIKPPPNILAWLSSLNISYFNGMKFKLIPKQLIGKKVPKDAIEKLRKEVLGDNYLEESAEAKKHKVMAIKDMFVIDTCGELGSEIHNSKDSDKETSSEKGIIKKHDELLHEPIFIDSTFHSNDDLNVSNKGPRKVALRKRKHKASDVTDDSDHSTISHTKIPKIEKSEQACLSTAGKKLKSQHKAKTVLAPCDARKDKGVKIVKRPENKTVTQESDIFIQASTSKEKLVKDIMKESDSDGLSEEDSMNRREVIIKKKKKKKILQDQSFNDVTVSHEQKKEKKSLPKKKKISLDSSSKCEAVSQKQKKEKKPLLSKNAKNIKQAGHRLHYERDPVYVSFLRKVFAEDPTSCTKERNKLESHCQSEPNLSLPHKKSPKKISKKSVLSDDLPSKHNVHFKNTEMKLSNDIDDEVICLGEVTADLNIQLPETPEMPQESFSCKILKQHTFESLSVQRDSVSPHRDAENECSNKITSFANTKNLMQNSIKPNLNLPFDNKGETDDDISNFRNKKKTSFKRNICKKIDKVSTKSFIGLNNDKESESSADNEDSDAVADQTHGNEFSDEENDSNENTKYDNKTSSAVIRTTYEKKCDKPNVAYDIILPKESESSADNEDSDAIVDLTHGTEFSDEENDSNETSSAVNSTTYEKKCNKPDIAYDIKFPDSDEESESSRVAKGNIKAWFAGEENDSDDKISSAVSSTACEKKCDELDSAYHIIFPDSDKESESSRAAEGNFKIQFLDKEDDSDENTGDNDKISSAVISNVCEMKCDTLIVTCDTKVFDADKGNENNKAAEENIVKIALTNSSDTSKNLDMPSTKSNVNLTQCKEENENKGISGNFEISLNVDISKVANELISEHDLESVSNKTIDNSYEISHSINNSVSEIYDKSTTDHFKLIYSNAKSDGECSVDNSYQTESNIFKNIPEKLDAAMKDDKENKKKEHFIDSCNRTLSNADVGVHKENDLSVAYENGENIASSTLSMESINICEIKSTQDNELTNNCEKCNIEEYNRNIFYDNVLTNNRKSVKEIKGLSLESMEIFRGNDEGLRNNLGKVPSCVMYSSSERSDELILKNGDEKNHPSKTTEVGDNFNQISASNICNRSEKLSVEHCLELPQDAEKHDSKENCSCSEKNSSVIENNSYEKEDTFPLECTIELSRATIEHSKTSNDNLHTFISDVSSNTNKSSDENVDGKGNEIVKDKCNLIEMISNNTSEDLHAEQSLTLSAKKKTFKEELENYSDKKSSDVDDDIKKTECHEAAESNSNQLSSVTNSSTCDDKTKMLSQKTETIILNESSYNSIAISLPEETKDIDVTYNKVDSIKCSEINKIEIKTINSNLESKCDFKLEESITTDKQSTEGMHLPHSVTPEKSQGVTDVSNLKMLNEFIPRCSSRLTSRKTSDKNRVSTECSSFSEEPLHNEHNMATLDADNSAAVIPKDETIDNESSSSSVFNLENSLNVKCNTEFNETGFEADTTPSSNVAIALLLPEETKDIGATYNKVDSIKCSETNKLEMKTVSSNDESKCDLKLEQSVAIDKQSTETMHLQLHVTPEKSQGPTNASDLKVLNEFTPRRSSRLTLRKNSDKNRVPTECSAISAEPLQNEDNMATLGAGGSAAVVPKDETSSSSLLSLDNSLNVKCNTEFNETVFGTETTTASSSVAIAMLLPEETKDVDATYNKVDSIKCSETNKLEMKTISSNDESKCDLKFEDSVTTDKQNTEAVHLPLPVTPEKCQSVTNASDLKVLNNFTQNSNTAIAISLPEKTKAVDATYNKVDSVKCSETSKLEMKTMSSNDESKCDLKLEQSVTTDKQSTEAMHLPLHVTPEKSQGPTNTSDLKVLNEFTPRCSSRLTLRKNSDKNRVPNECSAISEEPLQNEANMATLDVGDSAAVVPKDETVDDEISSSSLLSLDTSLNVKCKTELNETVFGTQTTPSSNVAIALLLPEEPKDVGATYNKVHSIKCSETNKLEMKTVSSNDESKCDLKFEESVTTDKQNTEAMHLPLHVTPEKSLCPTNTSDLKVLNEFTPRRSSRLTLRKNSDKNRVPTECSAISEEPLQNEDNIATLDAGGPAVVVPKDETVNDEISSSSLLNLDKSSNVKCSIEFNESCFIETAPQNVTLTINSSHEGSEFISENTEMEKSSKINSPVKSAVDSTFPSSCEKKEFLSFSDISNDSREIQIAKSESKVSDKCKYSDTLFSNINSENNKQLYFSYRNTYNNPKDGIVENLGLETLDENITDESSNYKESEDEISSSCSETLEKENFIELEDSKNNSILKKLCSSPCSKNTALKSEDKKNDFVPKDNKNPVCTAEIEIFNAEDKNLIVAECNLKQEALTSQTEYVEIAIPKPCCVVLDGMYMECLKDDNLNDCLKNTSDAVQPANVSEVLSVQDSLKVSEIRQSTSSNKEICSDISQTAPSVEDTLNILSNTGKNCKEWVLPEVEISPCKLSKLDNHNSTEFDESKSPVENATGKSSAVIGYQTRLRNKTAKSSVVESGKNASDDKKSKSKHSLAKNSVTCSLRPQRADSSSNLANDLSELHLESPKSRRKGRTVCTDKSELQKVLDTTADINSEESEGGLRTKGKQEETDQPLKSKGTQKSEDVVEPRKTRRQKSSVPTSYNLRARSSLVLPGKLKL